MIDAQPADLDQDVAKYRRRMRGLSIFFIVMSGIGLLWVSVLALDGGTDEYPVELLWERGFYAAVILLTALMAWNGSRFGAVLLLLIILSGYADLASVKDSTVLFGLGRTVLYTILAVILIWSANRYHQECAIHDEPIGGNSFIRWGGLVLSLPAILLVGLGVALLDSPISTAVIAGSDMEEEHVEWLKEQEFLLADETSLFFYSEGLFSISEGGSLLTDKYVGVWWQEDGDLSSQWFLLGEVCRIETIDTGDFFTYATYKVHSPGDENWLLLVLSIEDDGDDRFIRRLSLLNKNNQHPIIKAACKAGEPIDRTALALAHDIQPTIVTGDLITSDQTEWLKEQNYLTDEETPLKFYSYGNYHIEEGGSLLTDKYFGVWFRDKGTPEFSWAELGEICTINETDPDDLESNAVYKITFGLDDWYDTSLSRHKDGDKALIKQVRELNAAAQTPEALEICKARKKKQD